MHSPPNKTSIPPLHTRVFFLFVIIYMGAAISFFKYTCFLLNWALLQLPFHCNCVAIVKILVLLDVDLLNGLSLVSLYIAETYFTTSWLYSSICLQVTMQGSQKECLQFGRIPNILSFGSFFS